MIVAGETGSGKTTQLPKVCLAAGYGVRGLIGHTQPRRLAARTVSQRIAQELKATDEVAFTVRFADTQSPNTLIKVMTDGILLTEIRHDRWLEKYDVIIIDEAHERSLNIDFLLGYLRRVLARRPDLKLVVTSATIDVERFSRFFNDAPIINVGGRTYPVELVYQGPFEDLHEAVDQALEDIETRPHKGASDVLVFLSGEREIFELAKHLRRSERSWEVLPLYARLSNAEQQKVFSPGQARRRIVLATNVAETSITVPNIGFVIDPGMARINRYSYRSKLQRLPIEPISQASADQRKGRCGRIAPGVCIRLYDEADYQGRPAFTDAEIRRVNLASVVLQMQAFNLGDISRFPFIDPPEPRAIKDAYRLLDELQALKARRLTQIGRHMARMPVDPRLARMLVEANQLGALKEMLVIAAALSVQDPRERPAQKTAAADASHAEFFDPRSDFLSWLKLWDWLEHERAERSNNQFRRLLNKRFLHPSRVREWREVHRQLRTTVRELGYRENASAAGYAALHEAIISGSLSLVAQHDEKGNYVGARNLKLRIFPGSGVEKSPRWIVAAEIAETARVYARSVARVEAGQIERQAQHLVKKQYDSPYWSAKRGEVMANQRVSLYGLRLADNRKVSFAREDPALARDLFIREGLIAGAIDQAPSFLTHNLKLVAEVLDLEAKGRRRGLLVSDDELYAFYAQRLSEEVCGLTSLKQWLKKNGDNTLYMSEAFVQQAQDTSLNEGAFPPELEVSGLTLPLKYRFAPGDPTDGVSVDIPVGVLPGVNAEELEWLIPGLLPNLIEQWLRSLPKGVRKGLAPLPEKIDALVDYLLDRRRYRKGRFLSALSRLLADWYKVQVPAQAWDRERLDDHLKFNIRVIGPDQSLLRQGRDLSQLRDALKESGREAPRAAAEKLEDSGLKTLPESPLEEFVLVGSAQAPVMQYPGLKDQGDHVDVVLFNDAAERDRQTRAGYVRLVMLALGKVSQYFRKELDKHPQLGLHFAPLGDAQTLKAELLSSVVWYCFLEDKPLPESQSALQARIKAHRPELAGVFTHTTDVFAEILRLRFECRRELDTLTSPAYEESRADIETVLDRLAPVDVLSRTPLRYLPLLPRYLTGVLRRIEHLPGHVKADQQRLEEIKPLELRWAELREAELFDAGRHLDLGFLLQELRMFLFAQQLARAKLSPHPLDTAYFGNDWKASVKKVSKLIEQERQRVGLA